jgi:2-dehydro-3-deoxy-D-arabinonate dehydratase
MILCRFQNKQHEIHVGAVADDGAILDLAPAGVVTLHALLETDNPAAAVSELTKQNLPRLLRSDIRLLAPVEQHEVWAAGVTYLRSKNARMEESDFSANAYDRVYEAERPELFFKSLAHKVVALDEAVGIRRDARWSVPEPELALVFNSRAALVGYAIGNDMSSRDIEGENLLYLPQAKTYSRSCALGPWIRVGVPEDEARKWTIRLQIERSGKIVFHGETSVGQIKRTFNELREFLFRSQSFPHGVVLLTGTGVVPPDQFTLQENDAVSIEISGIGSLRNPVMLV